MIISVPTSKNLYQSFASINDKVIEPLIRGIQSSLSSEISSLDFPVSDEELCIPEYPEELELAYTWQTSISDDWTSISDDDDSFDDAGDDDVFDETRFVELFLSASCTLDCLMFGPSELFLD